MQVDITQSLLCRGSILTCCECGATASILKKGELPAGWIISKWWPGEDQRGQQIDMYCPEHDPIFDVPTEALIQE